MDEYTENSLIANSGLHFKTTRLEINPEEPLVLEGGKTLKYTFLETVDFFNDSRVRFDICSNKSSVYIPINYARNVEILAEAPNGFPIVDEMGVPTIKPDVAVTTHENYPSGAPELISINSLLSYRLKIGHEQVQAFDLLLDKWLPMPMYEEEVCGQSMNYPNGWCRVKISKVGERRKNGIQQFRLIWAFDTRLAQDMAEGILRPAFLDGNDDTKVYSLCNRTDLLLGNFLNIPDGQNEAPIGDYLASLLQIDLSVNIQHKYKFLAFYVYLINFLRLSGAAPRIVLFNDTKRIPVDMSVDIGNSRTCAVLFEKGDFTKAKMLRIRDLSEPWRTYENAFDMRIAFRRADFGGDLTQDKSLFQWPSLVRVGEEAKHLVYRALENHGIAERTTNYSSPKRYLWDDKKFDRRWEFLVVEDDSTVLKVNPHIFIEGFTEHFDDDGSYLESPKEIDLFTLGVEDEQCHYSRSSLMTFVMIEMMQQAFCFINSSKFREMHGSIDCQRYLRNVVVTCPTAMPLKEQRVLRSAAVDASRLLHKLNPDLPEMSVVPSPDVLLPTEDKYALKERGWLYDEAFASQLVYLYAELAERYKGKVDQFLQLKGHLRPEIAEMGFEGNALTIGTIDIGAGTTDVMLTAYAKSGVGQLTPMPLYYDSFYTAGDDIVHNIIRDIILEGPNNDSPDLGSINSALRHRLLGMSPDELLQIPRIKDTPLYSMEVEDIRRAMNEEEAVRIKHHLIQELMHHFFAGDAATMSEKDRQCRLDFCTQVSLPISQFFLELLKQKRPSRLYTFDELFPAEKPASYLLDHFRYHFGFSFEGLQWKFDPAAIGQIVCDTMRPIVKAMSAIVYAFHCDILVLSGRPTNLEPLTELFHNYIPLPPNRMVLLNQYRVGRWFPLATPEGYFQENQKAVVAVGAEVGYLASKEGFHGLVLDFSRLAMGMHSTANYLGRYDEDLLEVRDSYLTPTRGSFTLKSISSFPYYIGCKQFDAPKYQARPLFAIYNHSGKTPLNIMLQRTFFEDRELVTIEDITDQEGDSVDVSQVEIKLQTLSHEGCFWMDKGAFILKVQEK